MSRDRRGHPGGALIALVVLSSAAPHAAAAGEPAAPDPVVIRLMQPDAQARRVLALFDGARLPHPAAALAAWKRAGGDGLGKPVEALITLFNPEMASEWRAFNGARVWIDPNAPALRWRILVPHDDDGAVAALCMTARLSGGAEAEPLALRGRTLSVGRTAGPGSALFVADGSRVAIASLRTDLARTLSSDADDPPRAEGLSLHVDLARLQADPADRLNLARAALLAQAAGLEKLDALLTLRDDQARLRIDGSGAQAAELSLGTVPARWPAQLIERNLMALASFPIGPDRKALDRAFDTLARLERLDPARKGVASIRSRLDFTALAAGVNLELDLWPRLRGVTVAVTAEPDQPGAVSGVVLVLHLDAEKSARLFASTSAPRIIERLGGAPVPGVREKDTRRAWGKPVMVDHQAADVRIAWGADAIAAVRKPGAPGAAWTAEIDRKNPARVAAIWPARCLPELVQASPARRAALEADPPALWLGWNKPGATHDEIIWPGLHKRVRAFLETIPPAPIHKAENRR